MPLHLQKCEFCGLRGAEEAARVPRSGELAVTHAEDVAGERHGQQARGEHRVHLSQPVLPHTGGGGPRVLQETNAHTPAGTEKW